MPVAPTPNVEAMRLEFAKRRAQAGLSYEEIARKSGLSRLTVFRVVSGQQRGSLETWYSLAAAVELPFPELAAQLDVPDGRRPAT